MDIQCTLKQLPFLISQVFKHGRGKKKQENTLIMYKNVLHKSIAISNTGTTTATVQVNIKGEQTVFDSQKDKVLAN